MAVDERHERLHRRLEEILGEEEARTLIEDLHPTSHEHELLRKDMQLLLAQLEVRLLEKMNEQSKTFVRTFYVSNAAMVLAVATLAFGAARIA